MKIPSTILIIAGAFSGQSIFDAGAASQPPLTWSAIIFIFCGSIIGMLFVIGLQTLRSSPKYGQWAIYFFSLAAAYSLSSGLAAVAFAGNISPASVLFVAIGSGCAVGVLLSWWLYKYRHLNKQRQADG